LCPVAAIHDLLYGCELRPRALAGPWSRLGGQQWHEYIARLRVRIAGNRIVLPSEQGHALEVIRQDFNEWVCHKHAPDVDVQRFWNDLVEPYVRTRLQTGALQSIVGHALLPEVTVGNSQVEVPLDTGKRTYPIEARVDEIDLTAGVAIERTTLPLSQATQYKDVQLTAAALVLRSLPPTGIPKEWGAVRGIRRFVLEAPDGSVELAPGRQQFDAIHEAAAVIHDLATSHLAERPIRDLAQCTYVSPHEVCSHPYVGCFYQVPTFPQFRGSIRREVRTLCRAELYELMWQRDLGKYRLYMLNVDDLEFPAIPIEFLGIVGSGADSSVEVRLRRGSAPDYHECALIVGTPFIGVRRYRVRFDEDPTEATLRLHCDLDGLPLPNTGVLWPAIGQGFLLEGTLDFLVRNVQRDLFSHLKIGTSRIKEFQQEPALQLVDAIFGASPPLETS
jgi:hypothetical protein